MHWLKSTPNNQHLDLAGKSSDSINGHLIVTISVENMETLFSVIYYYASTNNIVSQQKLSTKESFNTLTSVHYHNGPKCWSKWDLFLRGRPP